MKLLKFELKKAWRGKQFAMLFLLVIVCVAGLFYRNVSMQNEIENRAYKEFEPHIQVGLTLRADYEKAMMERDVDDYFLEGYENMLAMNTAIRDWELAIRSHEWQAIPKIEQKFLQTIVQQNSYGFEYGEFKEGELELLIAKNDILVEHNLPYEDEIYSTTIPNFMKSASTLFLSLYGILILVLILGDRLGVEIENQTIKTIYTQPIKKWRIILSKLGSMMIAVFFMLIVFVLACILIPLAFGGQAGSFSYPQLVLASDGFTYISIGNYLIKLVALFIGVTIFSFSIVLLLNFLLKNRFSMYISALLVISGSVIITNQNESLQTTINPFYFFRFGELIERPDELGQFPNVLVLVGYSVVVLLLCYFIQSKGRIIGREKQEKRPFRASESIQTYSPLISILTFEWRKLWRQGFLKQVITMLLVLIIGGYLFLTHLSHQKEQNYLEGLKETIYHLEQSTIKFEKELQEGQAILRELEEKDAPLTENEEILKMQTKSFSRTYQNLLASLHDNFESSHSQLVAFQEGDWSIFYSHWIEKIKFEKGDITHHSIKSVDSRPTERIGLSDFTYKASINEKEILAERHLKPVFAVQYLSTIYDHFPNPVDRLKWERETRKTDNTGLFYIYTFFDSFVYFILLGILVFLFGVGFTSEKGRKRTLTLLVTQPLSKHDIFLGKTGVSMASTFIIALVSITLMVLVGTVGNRFGDWTYPVLYYDTPNVVQSAGYSGITASEGGFHFIHMGRYLVESSALFLVALLFLIALSLTVSLFFNNMISAITMTLIVAIGGYFLSVIPTISAIAHFSPFTYLNIGKIANGEISTVLTNSSIQSYLGIGVLLLSSMVLIGVGLLLFQKNRTIAL